MSGSIPALCPVGQNSGRAADSLTRDHTGGFSLRSTRLPLAVAKEQQQGAQGGRRDVAPEPSDVPSEPC